MSVGLIILIVIVGLTVVAFTVIVLRGILAPRQVGALSKLLAQGRSRQVLSLAKKILAKDPRSTDARYLLGLAYLKEERPELALSEFRIINETGRFTAFCREPEFRRKAGELYDRFGQVEEALKEYLLLLKLDATDPEASFRVGTLFERRGDAEKAAGYYARTVQLQPGNAEAHARMGLLLYRAKRPVEAKKALEAATRLDAGNATACFYLGKILREGGDSRGALKFLERATRDPALKAKAFLEAGTCSLSTGDMERAIGDFQRAIKAATGEENTALYARYYLGVAYEKTRAFDKAVEQWQAVHAVKPTFRDVEEKLSQYRQLTQDDGMKDYLTSTGAEFTAICRKLAEGLKLEVQGAVEIPDGCELTALEPPSGMIQRRLSYLIRFLRPSAPVDDSSIRAFLERMKAQRADRGVMASASGFTRKALALAQTRPLDLIDKNRLAAILKGKG